MATDVVIDDSLYSRQRYVLGDIAMGRMACSSVLVVGQGGLGVEIAKNIALAGIKSLTIQDDKSASTSDLGTQFFLREEDVTQQRNRADASAQHLSQLNPYVSLKTITTPLNEATDLSYLRDFQCIVLTEAPLNVLMMVSEFCRAQTPPIKFIVGDVYGVFCSAFCDFGPTFEVLDRNGEEPKEVFIADITKENPGVVTCLENTLHKFDDGDVVSFREVNGMNALNGKQCRIKIISPTQFSICDTSGSEFLPYQHGGIATQVKVPMVTAFKPLAEEITDPTVTLTPDPKKMEAPLDIHLGYLALKHFQQRTGRFPRVRCAKDAEELLKISLEINQSMKTSITSDTPELREILKTIAFTSEGCLPPLCATLGGILAQEALKSLTGKFTPLSQWFHLDAREVIAEGGDEQFQPRGDRYDSIRVCIGDELCKKVTSLKIFMVGCGAIGCEMLKNYALLGVGTGPSGKVTITDNDLIEKSNLNRQFLFRSHHIQQPKSTTAKRSVLEMNPAMNIEAQQDRVCPQTESTVYTDQFFVDQDICVNALDNLEARRYMDSRCVTNQRPLMESGTMGAKAHVQVIVPHVTESYNDGRDPDDHDVPYCTLKSFPASIEHCIEWARDKFESSFSQKPNLVNEFCSQMQNPAEIIERLKKGMSVDGAVQASKVLYHRPSSWADCLTIGRLKFEKYFNHRAKQLIHSFPADTKMQDGTLFWQSPKRPPAPVIFDPENQTHKLFVVTTARLYAGTAGVSYSKQDRSSEVVMSVLSTVKVPEFRPSSKRIVTDESVKKADTSAAVTSGDELLDSARRLETLVNDQPSRLNQVKMYPASFEKDDNTNGHIDFITAAANLRAVMYNIEPADWFKAKKIAGRIIPAIATTTASVAGWVMIELIKVVKGCPLGDLKNCFLSLALPCMLLTEPGRAIQITAREGLTYTPWDRWEVRGNPGFTLQQFLNYFKETYGFPATSVVMGVKMIYIPIMPGHRKRLSDTMVKLLKPTPGQLYTDLVVMFEGEGAEDVGGPPVRYFFG